jgi:hypothetical protein
MQISHSTEARPSAESLPVYDDFPFLLTRLAPTLHHVIPLLNAFDESSLKSLARYQTQCNQLPTWLVLGENRCISFGITSEEVVTSEPPCGGILIAGRLKPSRGLAQGSSWWTEKSRRLQEYVDRQECPRNGRYFFEDLANGGRPASEAERRIFEGATSEGIPVGLSRCASCGEWKGRCLDPNPEVDSLIVTVSCRCENENRCASCLALLAPRKLNANYFDRADRLILHVPGFSACRHRCDTSEQRALGLGAVVRVWS